jgi:hypothetical protein
MDEFARAIGPIFIASFALQQLIELLDPILDAALGERKKWILSVVSLVAALGLTFGVGLRSLGPLGAEVPDWADALLTALMLTGGTKGINDLLKLIGYRKEAAKARLTPEHAARV